MNKHVDWQDNCSGCLVTDEIPKNKLAWTRSDILKKMDDPSCEAAQLRITWEAEEKA